MALSHAERLRIAFTNGCFDILRHGDISSLDRAKSLEDVLAVRVNTDEGIRRLKGTIRPINPLDDRTEVLAALGYLDHMGPFDEDTPHELIRVVHPHIFVKRGE